MALGHLFMCLYLITMTATNCAQFIGKPYVACENDGIALIAHVRDPFVGKIYAKGAGENCAKRYKIGKNSTQISLKLSLDQLETCGFHVAPTPNTATWQISGQFVIGFDAEMVTGADRAFAAHCQISNWRGPTILGVDGGLKAHKSMIFGKFRSPKVRMSIGEEVGTNFNIGDPIVFRWELAEKTGIFGIEIDECHVESDDGMRFQIINKGCSTDPELISDTRSSADRTRLAADSLMFRFPGHSVLHFKCAVRVCVRRLEHVKLMENGSRDDLCESAAKCGRKTRSRRHTRSQRGQIVNVERKWRIAAAMRFPRDFVWPTLFQ